VEKDSRNPPIIIWPEGTQGNGKYLLPFKRGAFESLKAVTPVTTSFKSYGMVEYSWDCLGFFEQGVATFAGSFATNTTTILPPLKPTEFMFEKFADKGKSKAEIFAWVTRDIMSKQSGLPTIEVLARDKARYKAFMTGKVDEIEHEGKVFTAKPIPSLFPCLRKKKKAAPEKSADEPKKAENASNEDSSKTKKE